MLYKTFLTQPFVGFYGSQYLFDLSLTAVTILADRCSSCFQWQGSVLAKLFFYTCSSELFQTLADGPECQNANCWLIKRSLTCQLSSLISVWWSDKSVWKQCWSVNSQWKSGYGVFLVVRAWRGQTISCCVLHVREDTFGQRPERTNNLSS